MTLWTLAQAMRDLQRHRIVWALSLAIPWDWSMRQYWDAQALLYWQLLDLLRQLRYRNVYWHGQGIARDPSIG